jgi:hypothetical protein
MRSSGLPFDIPATSAYVMSINDFASSLLALLRTCAVGQRAARIAGSMASTAPMAYSADMASGFYLEPPSASSMAEMTGSEMI